MKAKTDSSQALPRELPGKAPDSVTPLETLVRALADRLAQLPDCKAQVQGPQPCSPALDAWLVTQMSDAQFREFRVAYVKWVDAQRRVYNDGDFRVTLTPRRPQCDHGPAATPVPPNGPTPATNAAGAETAS